MRLYCTFRPPQKEFFRQHRIRNLLRNTPKHNERLGVFRRPGPSFLFTQRGLEGGVSGESRRPAVLVECVSKFGSCGTVGVSALERVDY
jgi:hypothetical protein